MRVFKGGDLTGSPPSKKAKTGNSADQWPEETSKEHKRTRGERGDWGGERSTKIRRKHRGPPRLDDSEKKRGTRESTLGLHAIYIPQKAGHERGL